MPDWLLPAVFLSGFLIITALRAYAKQFWYDELFTLYTLRLGSPQKIWAGLTSGVDLNPPLLYLSTWIAQLPWGEGELATRLPSIAGFAALLWSVYRFIGRRLPQFAALSGATFVALTGAYNYAYEARAYGLGLGFTGLALLSWQRATDRADRKLDLLALSLSIAGALLSHCYGILLFVPLGLGELVRTVTRRRVDWPMLASLACPCAAIAIYIPLLSSSRGYSLKGPIFDPVFVKVIETYVVLLLPVVLPAIGALAFGLMMARKEGRRDSPIPKTFAPYELAAAYGFVLVPLVALAVARTVQGCYFPRYALISTIGFAILFAKLLLRFAGTSLRYPHLLPCALAGSFVMIYIASEKSPAGIALPPAAIAGLAAFPGADLVIADGQTFLELDHYLNEAAASRLVFPIDRESALLYMQTDCYDNALRTVQEWFPIRGRLVTWDKLPKQPFLVYGSQNLLHSWVLQRLAKEGAVVTQKSAIGPRALWEVSGGDRRP